MTGTAAPIPTMASALVALIRADIIHGAYPPGSKLVIKELCERYGSSLIPMREALSRLSTSGFVQAEDQRGFRVAAASAQDLIDITRARVLIETKALELSLRHGDVGWESRLVAAHHQLGRLAMRDVGAGGHLLAHWDEAHMLFHGALLSACGSPVLLELALNLRNRSTRYRHLSVVTGAAAKQASGRPPVRDVPAEHQALVEAALARDASRACQLLEKHFKRTADIVLKLMPNSAPQPRRA